MDNTCHRNSLLWKPVFDSTLPLITGAIGLSNEVFSEEVAPLLLTDVSCTGTESTLLNCTYNTRPQYLCGRFEDAGVVCQGVCMYVGVHACMHLWVHACVHVCVI